MLDKLIAEYGHGYSNGYGHKDYRSSGYGFEEQKDYMSHMESEGGYFDRQARYDHRVRLPANHDRPPMAHMPVFDEDDSDVEDFYKSSRSHHTALLPYHVSQPLLFSRDTRVPRSQNHQQQLPHMNFMPPPPMSQPHYNGKMGNGWQGRHEDAYHGGHGMQHHGEHGTKQHGMQHYGEHGMKQHGMQHHGEYGMKPHGMQHHGEYGMKQHDAHGMQHQDRLMAPQIPPHHVYMNPSHGTGSGHAVVFNASENWPVGNSGGGHYQAGWGSKGL